MASRGTGGKFEVAVRGEKCIFDLLPSSLNFFEKLLKVFALNSILRALNKNNQHKGNMKEEKWEGFDMVLLTYQFYI